MKYPAEVSVLPYGPEREEAIVRDCANTARSFGWNYHAEPRASIFKAIITRYGLKEDGHD